MLFWGDSIPVFRQPGLTNTSHYPCSVTTFEVKNIFVGKFDLQEWISLVKGWIQIQTSLLFGVEHLYWVENVASNPKQPQRWQLKTYVVRDLMAQGQAWCASPAWMSWSRCWWELQPSGALCRISYTAAGRLHPSLLGPSHVVGLQSILPVRPQAVVLRRRDATETDREVRGKFREPHFDFAGAKSHPILSLWE